MTFSAFCLEDLCVPPRLLAAFKRTTDCAKLAVVGGAVRDLLLHRVHFHRLSGLRDVDLVIELAADADPADPRPAAHRLADVLLAEDQKLDQTSSSGVGFCKFHSAYGTVELEVDGVQLDLASARREVYPVPGENPIVAYGTLEEDLARRDFSINSMALVFVPPGPHLHLLDPHGGQVDLARKQLRLLHNRSLEDDPTRIVRAARYVARLGFSLSPSSFEQVKATLLRWPWGCGRGAEAGEERVPPALGTRLRMELELLLQEEFWEEALACLQSWGGLALLDPTLQADAGWRRRLRWARRFNLPLLPALLCVSGGAELVARRLQLPHREQQLLAHLALLRQAWEACQVAPVTAFEWCNFLERPGWTPDTVLLAIISGGMPRRPLLRWWFRWLHIQSPIPAVDLIATGWKPGPELGNHLRTLRAERLLLEKV